MEKNKKRKNTVLVVNSVFLRKKNKSTINAKIPFWSWTPVFFRKKYKSTKKVKTAKLRFFVKKNTSPKKNKIKTNLPIKGLVSTDRSMKAALLDTTPWPVFKSFARDLAPWHCTEKIRCDNRLEFLEPIRSLDRANTVLEWTHKRTSEHQRAKISLHWLDGMLT